jgi:SynChlorMet cassette protein ScmD
MLMNNRSTDTIPLPSPSVTPFLARILLKSLTDLNTSAMKDNERPIANPHVVLREEFDDWAVLFNPDARLSFGGFGLNPTGVFVWKLLDGEHPIDDLLEELRDHAEGVPEDARDHIRVFVDALVAEGLAGFDIPSGLSHNPDKAAQPPEKWSPGALSGGNRFNYEPPKLVDLRGQPATGSCNAGTGGCLCSAGVHYFGACGSGSCAEGAGCGSGLFAKTTCTNGAVATYGACCTGTSAYSYC